MKIMLLPDGITTSSPAAGTPDGIHELALFHFTVATLAVFSTASEYTIQLRSNKAPIALLIVRCEMNNKGSGYFLNDTTAAFFGIVGPDSPN